MVSELCRHVDTRWEAHLQHCRRARRAPDNPHQQIIKRLLALEGDTIIDDTATGATQQVTQVSRVGS